MSLHGSSGLSVRPIGQHHSVGVVRHQPWPNHRAGSQKKLPLHLAQGGIIVVSGCDLGTGTREVELKLHADESGRRIDIELSIGRQPRVANKDQRTPFLLEVLNGIALFLRQPRGVVKKERLVMLHGLRVEIVCHQPVEQHAAAVQLLGGTIALQV